MVFKVSITILAAFLSVFTAFWIVIAPYQIAPSVLWGCVFFGLPIMVAMGVLWAVWMAVLDEWDRS